MRTPKYKAFYKPHNYIYHVTDMNFEGPDYTLREVKLSNGIWLRSDKLDDIILLEQTPYTDKNGEEIYEGDIIKGVGVTSYNKPLIRRVAFDDASARFGLYDVNGNITFEPLKWISFPLEIIGNIYENPELISKTPTHEH